METVGGDTTKEQLSPITETSPIYSNTKKTSCCDTLKTPKCRLLIVICSWQFFLGIERSVIIPTLWLYLLNDWGKEPAHSYYGAVLAAFNIAVFFFSPVFGILSGYWKISVKLLLIVSNGLEIVGNLLYFGAIQPWILLVGRFVAGIGGGCEVPLYADIVRCTVHKERIGVIILLLVSRNLGLILGPAFTLTVASFTFKIGQRVFTVYNFPGLLMAVLWIIHTIASCIIYPKITRDVKIENSDKLVDESETKANESDTTNPPSLVSLDENGKSSLNDNPVETKETCCSRICSCCSGLTVRWTHFIHETCDLKVYCDRAIFTMLVSVFSLYICVMGLEAVLPPVAQRYFSWDAVQISYIYLGCGAFIVVGYFIMQGLSKFLNDRSLLGLGTIILFIAYIGLTVLLIFVNSQQVILFATLIIFLVVVHVLGVQFCIASTESLFSKLCPTADAERGQSIFRTIVNLSFLIGPYLGGSLEAVAAVMMFIMAVLMAISGTCYLVSYRKLIPP